MCAPPWKKKSMKYCGFLWNRCANSSVFASVYEYHSPIALSIAACFSTCAAAFSFRRAVGTGADLHTAAFRRHGALADLMVANGMMEKMRVSENNTHIK